MCARMRAQFSVQLASTFVVLLLGCQGTADWYSGRFKTKSTNDQAITIIDWTGFGAARPLEGFLSQVGTKEAIFPRLDRIPSETTVKWRFLSDDSQTIHSQSIELNGVVPPNRDGTTIFMFDNEGVWTVTFEMSTE